MMRILAVLTVKNEASFLLEWLAHHKAIGITDFLVLSNDCDDGTDRMLDRLDRLGEINHMPNPAPHEGGIQFAAMKRADAHPLVKKADWIITLDVDEFINIHVGQHRISDLIEALPEATAIPLTWRLFGNAGVVTFKDMPVAEQFTRAAPEVLFWPWRAAMFKTLYRNDGTYRKLGIHRPRNPVEDRLSGQRWFDGSGRELPEKFRREQIFSPFGRNNYQLAQINHYALGSMQSFLVKADRGRAVHERDTLGLSYWVERNWCQDVDHSLSATAGVRNEELSRLKSDPDLARLHAEGVEWRVEQIRTLMSREPMRALFGQLLMTPPSRALTYDEARHIFAHAQSASGNAD